MPKPTYDELLEMLDNVSAALKNTVLYGGTMTTGDKIARLDLAMEAREVCDALLREEPDWVHLAKDAGYDGSPGGEKDWCIGNGMGPDSDD
jgi:hypothetical protein